MTEATILIRKGDYLDLPELNESELAHASDQRRVFIGDKPVTRSGDNAEVTFNFNIDLDNVGEAQYTITVDGNPKTLNVDFTVDNMSVTFTSAPPTGTDNIVFTHSSELMIKSPPEGVIDNPRDIALLAPATTQNLPNITIDSSRYSDVSIRYTIVAGTGNGRRKGVLNIALNESDNTFQINDNYTSNVLGTGLDYVFNGTMATGIFILNYTTTDTDPAQLTWIEENFSTADYT
jgi:hypothetical protein